MHSTLPQLEKGLAVVATNSAAHGSLTKGVIVDLRDRLHMICATPDGHFRLTPRGQLVCEKIKTGKPISADDFRE